MNKIIIQSIKIKYLNIKLTTIKKRRFIMPNLDQTGPLGQGPMTGRRMGRCTNYGA